MEHLKVVLELGIAQTSFRGAYVQAGLPVLASAEQTAVLRHFGRVAGRVVAGSRAGTEASQ